MTIVLFIGFAICAALFLFFNSLSAVGKFFTIVLTIAVCSFTNGWTVLGWIALYFVAITLLLCGFNRPSTPVKE